MQLDSGIPPQRLPRRSDNRVSYRQRPTIEFQPVDMPDDLLTYDCPDRRIVESLGYDEVWLPFHDHAAEIKNKVQYELSNENRLICLRA